MSKKNSKTNEFFAAAWFLSFLCSLMYVSRHFSFFASSLFELGVFHSYIYFSNCRWLRNHYYYYYDIPATIKERKKSTIYKRTLSQCIAIDRFFFLFTLLTNLWMNDIQCVSSVRYIFHTLKRNKRKRNRNKNVE